MIKKLTIIVFFLAFRAAAQTPLISEIELIGGPSLSNYWGKDKPEGQVINPTYFYGGGVSHRFVNRFGINAKFIYERRGNKMEGVETLYDDKDVPTTYNFVQSDQLNYLSLLVTLRYFLDDRDRFYVGLGGFASYLTKSTIFREMRSVQDGSTTYFYLTNDSYDDLDFGLTQSAGYRIPLRSKIMINIEMLGNLSVSNIVDSSLSDSTVRNFSLLLGVGFTFKL